MPALEESLSVLSAALDKHVIPAQSQIPQLSHYTTVEGLLGICETNCIWATCAQYSNDVSEVTYAQSVAHECIQKFFEERPLTEDGERLKTLWESNVGQDPFEDAYLTSFCESKDLLSQWRAYGRTAGFEIRFLGLSKLALSSPAVNRLVLSKVEYGKYAQQAKLEQLLLGSLESLDLFAGLKNRGIESEQLFSAASALLSVRVGRWLYETKHPSFAEEKEWRIIAFPNLRNPLAGSGYEHPEEVKLRPGRHSLVPYVELRPTAGKIPIVQIICGPGGHHKLTSKAVELLLASTGFEHVRVQNSKVPLAL